ncbi:MAG: ABC transporter ATP-binding protein [Bacillota bacterium]|nr:ABC transporter ATP-binding protein [Bacillota bacterium]
MSIIELVGIKKNYGKDLSMVQALKGIDLNIEQGEMVAIMGPSGGGKSTLLNIIGCIDTPTEGRYLLEGQEVSRLNFNTLSEIRNKKLSFIFQNFALLKDFSAIDNVIMPLNFRKVSARQKKELALQYLERLEIKELYNRKVKDLSGGQQQRVAIARALAQESSIILADEPTGALDQSNGKNIMTILKNLNKEYNKTVIIVTHDDKVASYCSRIVNIKDGILDL